MNKDYNDPTKQAVRTDTIIYPYRKLFGEKLPPEKQYWTLVGQLGEGSELDQVVKAGLIEPGQYHGVDFADKGQAPPAHTYIGELSDEIRKAHYEERFDPGIVYIDTMYEPEKAIELLLLILRTVNKTSGPCLVTWNVVIGNRRWGVNHTFEEIRDRLYSNMAARMELRSWTNYGKAWSYAGTGKSDTTMGSIAVYRKT